MTPSRAMPPAIAVADLAGLAHLRDLDSWERYTARADGPWKVGHITTPALLTRPVMNFAGSFWQDIEANPGAAPVPHEDARHDARRRELRALLREILAIDDALGFGKRRRRMAATFDQRPVQPGQAQRNSSWHQDLPGRFIGYDFNASGAQHFTRFYLAASALPTLFLPETETRRIQDAPSRGFIERFKGARIPRESIPQIAERCAKDGSIITGEPFALYLMSGAVWHKSPSAPATLDKPMPRAFLHVACYGA